MDPYDWVTGGSIDIFFHIICFYLKGVDTMVMEFKYKTVIFLQGSGM